MAPTAPPYRIKRSSCSRFTAYSPYTPCQAIPTALDETGPCAQIKSHWTYYNLLRGKNSNSTRQLDRQSETPRHRQMGQGLSRPRKMQAPEPRFCLNPPRRRGGGTAQGRISRDAAASTIRAHTQGTLPALVGAFFSRRPCMNPLPCPILFVDPKDGVPQRPIGLYYLSPLVLSVMSASE